MKQVTTSYMLDVAQQMSLVGVFLGGISITVLISLIVFHKPRKMANLIVAISALGACSLLISVVSSLRLLIALHPDFPSVDTTSLTEINLLWRAMVAGYGVGVLSLISSIGLSGWLKSKKTGILTTSFAVITTLFFALTSIFN